MFPPPLQGEGSCTYERRWRDGGRAGGTTCPGTCGAPAPLASGLLSPATGEGPTSCAKKRRRGVVGEGNMYGLFPCVPVPLCSVGAGRAADPCSGELGPGGTGECSWACGDRVVREGGVPHRVGSEHGFATRCWSSGRWVGASRGRGQGGRSARVPRSQAGAGAEGGPQWACAGHATWLVGRWLAGPGRRRRAGVGQGAALRRPRALSARQPRRLAGNAQGRSLGRGQTRRAGWAGPLHMSVQGYSAGMWRGTAQGCVRA